MAFENCYGCYENSSCVPSNSISITDLCNDVLIEIFSYLDMYDRTMMLPKVCKRFETIAYVHLPKIKEIESVEFLDKKWKSQKNENIFKVLKKIGPGLKSFKLNSSVATKKKQIHFKLMLRTIREHCLNIDKLQLTPVTHVNDLRRLPTSIRTLHVDKFNGKGMDLKYLRNLEILYLGMEYLPDRFEIKVPNRLKETEISLNLNEVPPASTINQLSAISDHSSVNLCLNFQHIGRIRFNFLDTLLNLRQLALNSCLSSDSDELNNMLMILAKQNTVENFQMCCTSVSNAIISPKTISLITSQWTNLKEMYLVYNDFISSLARSLFNVHNFTKIELHYIQQCYVLDSKLAINVSKEKLIELMDHFQTFDVFHYFPNDQMFLCKLIHDENVWREFCNKFLSDRQDSGFWNARNDIYIEISFK